MFRYTPVNTLDVIGSYLNYYCLPISLKQSRLSPLTCDFNKAFSLRALLLTGDFLFFRSFSLNPRDGYVEKSQQISCF